MLASFKNIFTPSTYPSALIAIGNFGPRATITVLHLVPENGTTEQFGFTPSQTKFNHYGAKEQPKLREQIGTATLYVGDGESEFSFLDDLKTRIHKRQKDSLSLKQEEQGYAEVAQMVQTVLKPAALDAIREREGRGRSMNATQTYPVYIVYVKRSKPGGIIPTDFRSIS
ncbi:uncharacterized protein N7483_003473 [Penicillium malachiteum]|uniref:uncharacterized protein n=1 Tax=Penicillium malachiteum TaxID=1324776 RepID=UPI002548BC8B|nr:uncharacterized protein N7483_003473 [Penicillium malachiteum]KAJ5728965.1 hypothetical protein N7483_003473 [Penicillium malachiteum]